MVKLISLVVMTSVTCMSLASGVYADECGDKKKVFITGEINNNAIDFPYGAGYLPTTSGIALLEYYRGGKMQRLTCALRGDPVPPESADHNFDHSVVCNDLAKQSESHWNTTMVQPPPTTLPSDLKQRFCRFGPNSVKGVSTPFEEDSVFDSTVPPKGVWKEVDEGYLHVLGCTNFEFASGEIQIGMAVSGYVCVNAQN